MRGEISVRVLGVTTEVWIACCVSVDGSRYTAFTSALSLTCRRLKSKKNELFLLNGPPIFAMIMRLEKSGLIVEYGFRELKMPSLSLNARVPRKRSVPGLVRISMRPKPNRSYSAEKGFW